MTAIVVQGDAAHLPLPDASVDLIVTSPPYFQLRSYSDGGVHYDGQLGAEDTPAEYVSALLGCTREWLRVLKPGGSMWVNLGDKYSQYEGSRKGHGRSLANGARTMTGQPLEQPRSAPQQWGVAPKSLMGIPWRYALGCIDELGLILRAEVVWSKPSGMPESVTDRVRRSHEQWFHLVTQPRYYSAVDEIRQPHKTERGPRTIGNQNQTPRHLAAADNVGWKDRLADGHPLGALPGSVWTVATEPLVVPEQLGVAHFAAFPTEWPKRLIQGWSPSGICTGCGEGRRSSLDKSVGNPVGRARRHLPGYADPAGIGARDARYVVTGYTCDCPTSDAPTRPAVICDPFGGTGTTALVASCLGRVGVSVDLSHDYGRVARWRTTDPRQRAKVLEVAAPPVEADGQESLFDLQEANP